MSIVVNDIVANRGFAYGYGYEEGYAVPGYGYSYGYTYGYGYGSSYGNGYYVEDERKGILNWLKFKKCSDGTTDLQFLYNILSFDTLF